MPVSIRPSEIRTAVNALVLVEGGLSERFAVAKAARQGSNHDLDQRVVLRLVMGVLAVQDVLDKIVHSALPNTRLSSVERSLARLVAWTSLELESETRLAQGLRELAPAGFQGDFEYLLGSLQTLDVNHLLDGLDDADRVALQTHHPSWWVDYCFRVFGRGEAVRILSSEAPPKYVRLNSLRNGGKTALPSEAEAYQDLLKPVESFDAVYEVSGSPSSFSPLFASGLFQFQDLASHWAVLAGEPAPGESVLDLCAAPGAKTCALAQLMKNRGRIVSVDYSRPRMKAWRREVDRLGVGISSPVIEDASRLGVAGAFDLVLLDPPCSGTGILYRNPRMKWHLSPERVERYSRLQKQMLEEAHRHLGSEGRIVYCTCSLTIEENEAVVSGFLGNHPEMEARPLPLDSKYGSPGLMGLTEGRRFYPHRDRTAGYFIGRLEHSA